MGYRLQATIVLSCPGIDLGPLSTRRDGSTTAGFEGLDAEVRAVRTRIDSTIRHRIEAAGRRGRRLERALRAEGRWDDDESVRARLRSQLPRLGAKDFPVEDPPELSEGWERLPLFFDGRSAPLAFARQIGGWEVWQLAPDGGGETLGVFPPPERPPSLEPRAERLLDSYLRYVIERDVFLASAHLDALEGEDGTVAEWAEIGLGALGAMVLARGAVRAKIRGSGEGVLAERDVADGIRATDMDWLDRPTWGDRL